MTYLNLNKSVTKRATPLGVTLILLELTYSVRHTLISSGDSVRARVLNFIPNFWSKTQLEDVAFCLTQKTLLLQP